MNEASCTIGIGPTFLIDHFLPSIVEVPTQLQAFVAGNLRQINYCHLPLSAQMFELATKLVNNSFVGALALIYTEARRAGTLMLRRRGFLCAPQCAERAVHATGTALSAHGARLRHATARATSDH